MTMYTITLVSSQSCMGCGWNGLAIMAARDYGCHVTAITVSKAQFDHATAWVRDAELKDWIEVRLQDYRDVEGAYDRILAIEMFEAVNKDHWPTFFDVIRRRLKPGGIAGLRIITIDSARFTQYSRGADFIQTYIFLGGRLSSSTMLEKELACARLHLTDVYAFAKSYVELWSSGRIAFSGRGQKSVSSASISASGGCGRSILLQSRIPHQCHRRCLIPD